MGRGLHKLIGTCAKEKCPHFTFFEVEISVISPDKYLLVTVKMPYSTKTIQKKKSYCEQLGLNTGQN